MEQKARERGEELPSEARFDSNCITPGTEFMVRLHEQLKYFVTYKMSTDRQWKNVKVILSGHEVSCTITRTLLYFILSCLIICEIFFKKSVSIMKFYKLTFIVYVGITLYFICFYFLGHIPPTLVGIINSLLP